MWNEDDAVHIKSSDIENSTLAVGTHLIALSALNDELYKTAEQSAEDSGQNRIYYKSELAKGTWYDITSASSLKDITTQGTPVQDSEIEALFFTYHTKSDGKTYDLRTNKAVNLYDINNPYDLEKLEELFPLKNQYDQIKETQADSKAGKQKLADIGKIFSTNVKNDTTNQCDAALAALQKYKDSLNGASADKTEAVQKVMSAVDASRRAQVFTVLSPVLSDYSQKLGSIQDTSDSSGKVTEGASVDTTLQSAVNDSLSNVTASLTEQQGKMLSEGTTVMSGLQYQVSQQLITDAKAGNNDACGKDVAALNHLDNIMNGVVKDKAGELSFLDGTLLPKATDRYVSGLRAGENSDYKAAVSSHATAQQLKSIADTNTGTLNASRNELESYISAEVLRLENAKAKDFVGARLKQSEGYSDSVPKDAFYDGACSTVQSHIDFLSQKLKKITNAGGGDDLDKMIAQKADLKTQYLSALDKNDLEGAKKIKDQMDALDAKIKDAQDGQADALSAAQQDLTDLEAKLAAVKGTANEKDLAAQVAEAKAKVSSLQSGMSDGSVGQKAASLKDKCLSIVASDSPETGTLGTDLDSLGGMLNMNYKIVFPALQQIHSAMVRQRDVNGKSDFNDAIAKVEKLILNNKAAYDASLKNGLDADGLGALARKFFAGEIGQGAGTSGSSSGAGSGYVTGLSAGRPRVVYLLALQMYYDQTKNSAAKTLLSSVAQQEINAGNLLVFERVNDVASEYLPVTAIADYTGMRYVWNQNQLRGTLAQGGAYYGFTVYSDAVLKSRDGTEKDRMTQAAKYLGSVHIPEDYAKQKFKTEAVYLSGTSYGALSADDLKNYAEQLFSLMMNG